MLETKRIYEPAAKSDGVRVLIDRLWPRGVSREKAKIDHWFRELAPSTELRKWYDHEPTRWDAFRKRYAAELDRLPERVDELREVIAAAGGRVTLVFGSKEEKLNNATALVEYLARDEAR